MNEKKSAIGVFENFAEEYLNFEKTPKKNIFGSTRWNFFANVFTTRKIAVRAFMSQEAKAKVQFQK